MNAECGVLSKLVEYFSRENNLVDLIKNKYSFHYDKAEISKEIDKIRNEDVLKMLVTEARGNSTSEFSDRKVDPNPIL
jgi:hypothetical protein